MHVMAPDQLERYRKAVDAPKAARPSSWCWRRGAAKGWLRPDPLELTPEAPKDHPRIELLKGKGITVWKPVRRRRGAGLRCPLGVRTGAQRLAGQIRRRKRTDRPVVLTIRRTEHGSEYSRRRHYRRRGRWRYVATSGCSEPLSVFQRRFGLQLLQHGIEGDDKVKLRRRRQ